MKPTERRADGWPLCPCCGEDELAVLKMQPRHLTREQLFSWYLAQELHCYVCGRVTVEAGAATRAVVS